MFANFFLRDDFMWLYDAQVQWLDPVSFLTWKPSGYFRPVPNLYFGLEYALFGVEAGGYYLSNLLLHVWCCTWLAVLTHALYGSRRAAVLAGLFFACLSSFSETIYWVSNLTTLLAGAGMLPALTFFVWYLRSRRRVHYAAALAMTAVCVLSHETGLSVGILLFLIEVRERGLRSFLRWRTWLKYAPFAALAAAHLLFQDDLIGVSGERRLGVPGAVRDFFPGVLANFPFLLSPVKLRNRLPFGVPLGLALVALILAGLYWTGGRERLKAGLSLLLATCALCLPFLLNVTNDYPLAGRYMYLPATAPTALLALFFAGFLRWGPSAWSRVRGALALALAVTLLAVNSYFTSRNNQIGILSQDMRRLVADLQDIVDGAPPALEAGSARLGFVGLPIENPRHLQCLGAVFLDLPYGAFEHGRPSANPQRLKALLVRDQGALLYEEYELSQLYLFKEQRGLRKHVPRQDPEGERLWNAFSYKPRGGAAVGIGGFVYVLEL